MLGRDAREHGAVMDRAQQGGILHRVELNAGQRRTGIKADTVRHRQRRCRRIAGDHHHAQTGGMGTRNRGGHFLARRVHHAEESQEAQIALDLGIRCLAVGNASACCRQHPQTVPGHVFEHPVQRLQRDLVERYIRLAVEHHAAARQHFFRRALEIDRGALASRDDQAHALARRAEGDFAGVRHGVPSEPGLERRRHQRALGRFAIEPPQPVALEHFGMIADQTGLEQGHQAGMIIRVDDMAARLEHTGRLITGAADLDFRLAIALRRPHPGDRHLAMGERARLVGADDRRGAQRLGRRQPAHQRIAPRHRAHTERQGQGHDSGQALGHHRYRQGNTGQEHLQRVTPEQKTAQRQHGRDRRRDHAEAGPETRQPLLQRCHIAIDRAGEQGDPAKLRRITGRGDQSGGASAHHQAAGIGDGMALGDGGVFFHRGRELVRGVRLPGQGGFIDRQIARFHQTQIGRGVIARL